MILMLESNEDTKNGNLAQAIRPEPKLNTKDLVKERARKDISVTWFQSNKQIESTFDTPDMEYCGARLLTFWYGMGDNKYVVLDIPHQSLLGEQVLKVIHLKARRLQCG